MTIDQRRLFIKCLLTGRIDEAKAIVNKDTGMKIFFYTDGIYTSDTLKLNESEFLAYCKRYGDQLTFRSVDTFTDAEIENIKNEVQ